jgi:uncharacterized membrane protein
MAGLIWVDSDYGLPIFLLLTILGAAAAFASGRALASTWSPEWLLAPAMIILSAGVRFLHFALFQEDLFSFHYYVVSLIVMVVVAIYGYRAMRARQMATQYSWAFTRSGFNWRAR